MSIPRISFRLVPNVHQGSGRAVGILEGHPDLCADVLLGLAAKAINYQRASMQRWTAGFDKPPERFHRFDGTDYFVFKDVSRKHRFYGFLCHPLPKNRRFLLCVLTTYANKKEDRSDPASFPRIQAWMDASATHEAIRFFYPDRDDPEED